MPDKEDFTFEEEETFLEPEPPTESRAEAEPASNEEPLPRWEEEIEPPPPAKKTSPARILLLLLLLIALGAAAFYFFLGVPEPAPPAPTTVKKQPISVPAPKPAPPAAAHPPAATPAPTSGAAPAKVASAPAPPTSFGVSAAAKTPAAPVPAPAAPAKPAPAKPQATAAVKPPAPAAAEPAAVAPVAVAPVPAKMAPAAGHYSVFSGAYLLTANVKDTEKTLHKLGFEPRRTPIRRDVAMTRLKIGTYTPAEAAAKVASLAKIAPDSFIVTRDGKATVYAGSYLILDKARLFADELYAKGIRVEEEPATVKETLQEISFGDFADRQAAEAAAAKARGAGLEATVIKHK